MKHIKKIVLFFIFLFGINIVIPTQNVFASGCNLTKDDISFEPIHLAQGSVYPVIFNNITLHIKTNGKCDDQKIKVKLRESDTPNNTNNNNNDNNIDINTDNEGYVDDDKDIVTILTKPGEDTDITYYGGEDDCDENSNGPDCNIYALIYDENNQFIVSTKTNLDHGDNFTSGILKAECDGSCTQGTDWDFKSTNANLPSTSNSNNNGSQNSTTNSVCNITKDDIYFDPLTITQGESYPNITGKNVILHIKTKRKCEKQKIGVKIREDDNPAFDYFDVQLSGKIPGDDDVDVYGNKNFADEDDDKVIFYTPENDDTVISYKADNDDCDTSLSGYPDCELYVEISNEDDINKGNIIASTEDNLNNGSNNFSSGIIKANFTAHTIGTNDWKFLNTNGTSAVRAEGEIQTVDTQRPNYDPNSPCILHKNRPEDGYIEGCYELLAPIQGIEKKDDGNGNAIADPQFITSEGGRRIAIRDIRTYKLGDYINKLFQIAIGILGVLSVVMIIIAGVQYMTVESIVGKSDAKQRIIGAVSGLLLSLGIFIILNTINPNLLEVNFGSGLKEVTVDIGDAPAKVNSDGTIGNSNVHVGDPWPPANSNYKTLRKGGNNSLETIIPGVYINKKECTTAGKHTSGGDDCTSVYFTPTIFNTVKNSLEKLKTNSGASKIIITGGSEYWWHSTHGPKAPIVDIRSDNKGGNDATKISEFLTTSTTYPAQCYKRVYKNNDSSRGFIKFALDETKRSVALSNRKNGKIGENITSSMTNPYGKVCTWNPPNHWHLVFK